MKRKTIEQKKETLSLIEAKRASGFTLDAALRDAGITSATYYNWKILAGRKTVTIVKTKTEDAVISELANLFVAKAKALAQQRINEML